MKRPEAREHLTGKKTMSLLFLIALLFYWGTVGVASVAKNTFYGEVDSVQHLREAKTIHQEGGIGHLILSQLKGDYIPTGAVHPFLAVFLSPFSTDTVHFYVRAKLITYTIAFAALLLAFFVLRKEFGPAVAAAAVTMTAVSAHFLFYSTIVAMEPLFMLSTVLAWLMGLHALQKGVWWALGAGAAILMVYLCKGYGYLLLGAWGLSFILMNPRAFWRKKEFYLVPLGFFAAGAPFLINNIIQHHTPFYTMHTSLMWVDDFMEFYTASYHEQGASAATYFQTHTIWDLLRRHALGVLEQFRLLSLAIRPVFAPQFAKEWWSLLLLPFALYGWHHDPDRNRKIFSLLLFLTFFSFGVMSISVYKVSRIYIPSYPIVAGYSVYGLLLLCGKRFKYAHQVTVAASLMLLLALGGAALATGRVTNPMNSVKVNPDLLVLMNVLEERVQDDEKIYWAPSHQSLLWTSSRLMDQNEMLLVTPNWGIINRKAEREGIEWMVADQELSRRYEDLFTPEYLEKGEQGLLPAQTSPPGWKLVQYDSNPPSDWILYQRKKEQTQE